MLCCVGKRRCAFRRGEDASPAVRSPDTRRRLRGAEAEGAGGSRPWPSPLRIPPPPPEAWPRRGGRRRAFPGQEPFRAPGLRCPLLPWAGFSPPRASFFAFDVSFWPLRVGGRRRGCAGGCGPPPAGGWARRWRSLVGGSR